MLVPICAYIVMAVSLNLTVGILGELSLGHAGFMSVGAFTGIVVTTALADSVPSPALRLLIAMLFAALFAGIAGVIVGVPVLRLKGDYLAIVTLAFGEIIKKYYQRALCGHGWERSAFQHYQAEFCAGRRRENDYQRSHWRVGH